MRVTSAKTTLIICPLPPAPVGVGSQVPLPPVWKVLSSTKSAMGIETFCQPAPLTISVPVGRLGLVLELVVGPIGGRRDDVVAVVIVLQVDLDDEVLAGLGLDPELEVRGVREVQGPGPSEPTQKPGVLKRLPQLASMDWLPGTGGLSPTTVVTWPPAEGRR